MRQDLEDQANIKFGQATLSYADGTRTRD